MQRRAKQHMLWMNEMIKRMNLNEVRKMPCFEFVLIARVLKEITQNIRGVAINYVS